MTLELGLELRTSDFMVEISTGGFGLIVELEEGLRTSPFVSGTISVNFSGLLSREILRALVKPGALHQDFGVVLRSQEKVEDAAHFRRRGHLADGPEHARTALPVLVNPLNQVLQGLEERDPLVLPDVEWPPVDAEQVIHLDGDGHQVEELREDRVERGRDGHDEGRPEGEGPPGDQRDEEPLVPDQNSCLVAGNRTQVEACDSRGHEDDHWAEDEIDFFHVETVLGFEQDWKISILDVSEIFCSGVTKSNIFGN